ncbi:hypothetical protein SK128_007150 [Halocaridina rubra]|uniref:Sex-determining region Y protein n=1 Tax=Halocaridina rubra TaxID=373956 RepID=A0AAN8X5B0_HALRR
MVSNRKYNTASRHDPMMQVSHLAAMRKTENENLGRFEFPAGSSSTNTTVYTETNVENTSHRENQTSSPSLSSNISNVYARKFLKKSYIPEEESFQRRGTAEKIATSGSEQLNLNIAASSTDIDQGMELLTCEERTEIKPNVKGITRKQNTVVKGQILKTESKASHKLYKDNESPPPFTVRVKTAMQDKVCVREQREKQMSDEDISVKNTNKLPECLAAGEANVDSIIKLEIDPQHLRSRTADHADRALQSDKDLCQSSYEPDEKTLHTAIKSPVKRTMLGTKMASKPRSDQVKGTSLSTEMASESQSDQVKRTSLGTKKSIEQQSDPVKRTSLSTKKSVESQSDPVIRTMLGTKKPIESQSTSGAKRLEYKAKKDSSTLPDTEPHTSSLRLSPASKVTKYVYVKHTGNIIMSPVVSSKSPLCPLEEKIKKPSCKVKRPMNPYMLYQKSVIEKVTSDYPEEHYRARLKRVANMWKELTMDEKTKWQCMADKLKEEHKMKNPDYVYNPYEARKKMQQYFKSKEERKQLYRISSDIIASDDSSVASRNFYRTLSKK